MAHSFPLFHLKNLQLNLSTFAFLFSEIIQYNQTRVQNIGELERR